MGTTVVPIDFRLLADAALRGLEEERSSALGGSGSCRGALHDTEDLTARYLNLSGGHVDLVFDGFLTTNPLVQQGRARMLALSAPQRSPLMPQVPTFLEAGLTDYQAYSWNNLYAPAATPAPALDCGTDHAHLEPAWGGELHLGV